MKYILPCIAAVLWLCACSTGGAFEDIPVPERFYRALDSLAQEQDGNAFERPIGEDWSEREPVELRLGLGDCIELADQRNFEILLQSLDTELAKARVLQAQASTDTRIISGINVEREETQIDSRLVGDTRDSNETTRQNANLRLIQPFETGTQVEVAHALRRITTNSPFNSFEWSSTLTLTVEQSLLDGFGFTANSTDRWIAEGERQAAVYNERAQRNNVSFSVAQEYWDLVLAREDLLVLQRQQGVDSLRVDRERRREAEGLATRLDVLRAESTLADREREIIQAEYLVDKASDELLKAIAPHALHGYHRIRQYKMVISPKEALGSETPDIELPDLTEEVSRALLNRDDLKASLREIENAGLRVEQRENSLLPNLNLELSGQLGGRGDDYSATLDSLSSNDNNTLYGGLTFEIPIQNSADRAAYQIAQVNQERSVLQARELEVDIIIEVVDSTRRIESGLKGIAAATKARDLSKLEYEAEVNRRENGLGTSFEVEQAESDFISSERDLIRARVVLELARLSLARATGSMTH